MSQRHPSQRETPPYLRAADPLPLESAEFNKLHAFYTHLAADRLTTTRCTDCGRVDWPPRGFCPACTSDRYEWVDLPRQGRVHGFTIQETGIPAGYPRPLIFAMVDVAGLRIFAPLVGVADPASVRIGAAVRFTPIQVADDPQGQPRHLPAFTPTESAS